MPSEARQIVIDWLKEYLNPKCHETVIDIGCGNWGYPEELLGRDITKVDIIDRPDIIKWDIQHATLKPKNLLSKYDWVICNQVLEHLLLPVDTIYNLIDLTSKNLIITTPFNFELHGNNDYYRFTAEFFRRVLGSAGLDNAKIKMIGGTNLKPIMVCVYARINDC